MVRTLPTVKLRGTLPPKIGDLRLTRRDHAIFVEPQPGMALEAASSQDLRNRVQLLSRFEQFPEPVQKMFQAYQDIFVAFHLLIQSGECRLLFCDFLSCENEQGEEQHCDLALIPLKLTREDPEGKQTLLINLYDQEDQLNTPERIFRSIVAGQGELLKTQALMMTSGMNGSFDN